jgi:diguanylate cyclase
VLVLGQGVFHSHLMPDMASAKSFVFTSMLVLLCAHVAAAFIARQRSGLESLATLDPLTGVGNRRAMEVCLEAITSANAVATAAVVDLDHFKRVNDQHGHDAGDAVLRQFASLTKASLRNSDHIFRMGGEEFLLVFPDTDEAGARVALDAVLAKVRGHLASPSGPVTVSIGACTRAPDSDWANWLACADRAMYSVKQDGRNGLGFLPADAPVAGPSGAPA